MFKLEQVYTTLNLNTKTCMLMVHMAIYIVFNMDSLAPY